MNSRRGLQEPFAQFFEAPSRETLRDLLKDHFGETDSLDFKKQWPTHGSLAKQVLGMANTANGCLVIGVDEKSDKTLEPIGLKEVKDKADIQNGLKNFLPSGLMTRYQVLDFSFEASEYPKIVGKRFQVLLVEYSVDHVPFVSIRASGNDIQAARVYVRREGLTAEATHDELQRIINRRIEAGYSTSDEVDLKQHLEQLRVLYSELPRYVSIFATTMMDMSGTESLMGRRENPAAPKEDFEVFVGRMIEYKKTVIAKSLNITNQMLNAE
jgi:hypothetical protein